MSLDEKKIPTTRTRVIGTTRILEPLAKGGMAEVFRGIQRPLKREVAVKIMLPERSEDPKAATRFRREALSLANLTHQNIVSVYDLIDKNNQLFMILEYVEGPDVSMLLDAGPLPLDVTLIIAEAVTSALEHAHFRRVIHRDIKPANVMISRRGVVKLTDFGIAKDLSYDDLTRAGMVVGTPSYIAPEILAGKKASFSTDLYAVGVLLFECFTGQKPFQGETHKDLFYSICQGKRPRLRSLAPHVPRAVEKIVDLCLALDHEKRWRRASALHREIERQLSRYLEGTASARLVSFLWDRGHIKEDDLDEFDSDDLSYSEAVCTRAMTIYRAKSGEARAGAGARGRMRPTAVSKAIKDGSLDRLDISPELATQADPVAIPKRKPLSRVFIVAGLGIGVASAILFLLFYLLSGTIADRLPFP